MNNFSFQAVPQSERDNSKKWKWEPNVWILRNLDISFIIYHTDAVTPTASVFCCYFEYTSSSHNLNTSASLSQFSLLHPLFVSLLPHGSLCVTCSVSDSQWIEKASLQIRAGRSTRSLEYKTVREQRLSDTYWISQHTRLTKQLYVRKNETLTGGKWGRVDGYLSLTMFLFLNKGWCFSLTWCSFLFLPHLLVSSLD